MCKLFLASICLTALLFASGFAEEPKPSVEAESPSSRSSTDSKLDTLDLVVEHLLKAAEHLEAAGLIEESAKLRDNARQRAVRDHVLSRKEAQLECLQEEVDRLRELTGQIPVVVIEIIAIEVDRAKLGLKALEFDKMVGFSQVESAVATASTNGEPAALKKSFGGSGIVEANPWRMPLFRELREKGAIDVLAHPTVQTVTRRPASVLVGGEIPIRVKSSSGDISIRSVPFGTRVEVRAVVLPNQRIRLQTTLELTKINSDGVVDDDGTAYPGISSRRLNTEVEMQLGQTLAVGRMVVDRPVADSRGDVKAADEKKSPPNGKIRPIAHSYAPSESIETVVFITPRLVRGVDTPRAMPVVPAAASDESEEAGAPGEFSPTDWDAFGPVVPVLKRRVVRP